MTPRPIFISHSCKDRRLAHPPPDADPQELARLSFARDVRDSISRELGDDRVWFDRSRLEPGDDWEFEIVEALHCCKAAIVLVTPDSIESPWVLREATVLADRKGRWPKLKLVVVLLAGSMAQNLKTHPWWGAIGIDRWQAVVAVNGAFEGPDATTDLDTIVAEVTTALTALDDEPNDPPFESWVGEVRAALQQLRAEGKEALFSLAAKVLRFTSPGPWTDDALAGLARALLRAEVLEEAIDGTPVYPLLRAVGAMMSGEAMNGQPSSAEKAICAKLKPVAAPALAAATIASTASVPPPHRPVIVAASQPTAAKLAVERATCRMTVVTPLTHVGGETNDLSAEDADRLAREAKKVGLVGWKWHVVRPFTVLATEDAATVVADFAAKIPNLARLVAVVERGAAPTEQTDGGPVVVRIDDDDEVAMTEVLASLDSIAGDGP